MLNFLIDTDILNLPFPLFLKGIFLYPFNPAYGNGWKLSYDHCWNMKRQKLFQCIEETTYQATDVFISTGNQKFKPIYKDNKIIKIFSAESNQSIEVKTYYPFKQKAISYDLDVEPGIISYDYSLTLELHLNNTIDYWIFMTDPKLRIDSLRPIVPACPVHLKKGTGAVFLYLKVWLIHAYCCLY